MFVPGECLAFLQFEPVEKSGKSDIPDGLIRGIASTESPDQDNEIILQDGLDWSYFGMDSNGKLKRSIPLTYEHPLGTTNIVGEAFEIQRTKTSDGVAATEITGKLYLTDPKGQDVWQKSLTMKREGTLRLGFSIEGRAKRRNKNCIEQAKVYSIAISPVPRNTESWWEPLAASMHAMLQGNPDRLQEILALSSVGYPAQGEAAQGTGGVEKVVPQSIQGKKGKGSVDIADYGLDTDDIAIAMLAKQVPSLSWDTGSKLISEFRRLTSTTK